MILDHESTVIYCQRIIFIAQMQRYYFDIEKFLVNGTFRHELVNSVVFSDQGLHLGMKEDELYE